MGALKQPTTKVGGSLIRLPPVFSSDSKRVFVAQEKNVKVLSPLTGEETGTSLKHEGLVKGMFLNPKNPLQLFTICSEYVVCLWDYEDGVKLKEWQIPHLKAFTRLLTVTMAPNENGVFYLLGICYPTNKKNGEEEEKEEEKGKGGKNNKQKGNKRRRVNSNTTLPSNGVKIFRFSIDLPKTTPTIYSFPPLKEFISMSMSPSNNILGCFCGRQVVLLSLNKDGEKVAVGEAKAPSDVVTLSFHPKEEYFVTGGKGGKIFFWQFSEKLNKKWEEELPSGKKEGKGVLKATITHEKHWHSQAVKSLCFTPDGASLMSGGSEGVGVIWQLETNQQNFMPRLGNILVHMAVSPNSQYYAVCLSSNAILFVSGASMKKESRVSGVRAPATAAKEYGAVKPMLCGRGFLADQVLLNTEQGVVQIFDVAKDKCINEAALLPIQGEGHGDHSRISLKMDFAVVGGAGKSMVSTERRDFYGEMPTEINLKFWYINPRKEVILHTSFRDPHTSPITGVCYDANKHRVVTSSLDGKFKIWENYPIENDDEGLEEEEGVEREDPRPLKTAWELRGEGKFLNYEARGCAISPDSSLLAVAFHQVVTLWDPNTCSLLKVLASPSPLQHITHLSFAGEGHPYLVACTNTHIFVWNLLTLGVWWSVGVKAVGLAVDPEQGRFAVFVPGVRGGAPGVKGPKRNDQDVVLIFDYSSPHPTSVWRTPLLTDLTFISINKKENEKKGKETEKEKGSCLVGLLPGKEMILFGEEGEGVGKGAEKEDGEGDDKFWKSDYERVYGGRGKEVGEERGEEGEKVELGMGEFSSCLSLFDVPSHVLPRMSHLSNPFLERMLKKRDEGEEEGEKEEKSEKVGEKEETRVMTSAPVDESQLQQEQKSCHNFITEGKKGDKMTKGMSELALFYSQMKM